MKLILRKTVDQLGAQGDVVEVKAGYARNYLIPQGLAFFASAANLRRLERERGEAEEHGPGHEVADPARAQEAREEPCHPHHQGEQCGQSDVGGRPHGRERQESPEGEQRRERARARLQIWR